jgi:RNA-binding protein NOB1
VSTFSAKSGDFNSLSKTDIKLIALSLMLENEVNPGLREKTALQKAKKALEAKTKELNKTSAVDGVESTELKPEIEIIHEEGTNEVQEEVGGDDDGSEEGEDEESEIPESTEADNLAKSLSETSVQDQGVDSSSKEQNAAAPNVEPPAAPKTFSWASLVKSSATSAPVKVESAIAKTVAVLPAAAPIVEDNSKNASVLPPPAPAQNRPNPGNHDSVILSKTQLNVENESKMMKDEDDGLGWINSDNFLDTNARAFGQSHHKKRTPAKRGPKIQPKVACFTTDFTMQNVLLQMGLHFLSADGMFVRTVLHWVLRCMGCFTVHTKDLTRLFCSRCGGSHLSRVAASVDEGGQLKLHLRKNYHVNTMGLKYSLPAPGKQDRFDGELLLREDQLLSGIWRQKVVKINKDIKSAFGDDVTSDVGLHLNKHEKIFIGLGKGNPNAQKGRERRGKKKNRS